MPIPEVRDKPLSAVYLLLGLVLCLGVVGILWSPDGEYFPFASFSLFSIVPNVRAAYDIEIDEFHGRAIEPPLLWEQVEQLGLERSSSEGFYAIQRMGAAYAEGRSDRGDYWRRLLERDFLTPPVHYQLVLVRYDPLERWNTGQLREKKQLMSFTRGG